MIDREEPTTVEGLNEQIDASNSKIYDGVDQLVQYGFVDKNTNNRPHTFRSRDIELIVENRDQDVSFTLTPAFIEAISYQDSNQIVENFVEVFDLGQLAIALNYAKDLRKKEVTRYIFADEIGLTLFEAEQILQSLTPVVEYHTDTDPDTVFDTEIDPGSSGERFYIVDLGTIVAIQLSEQNTVTDLNTLAEESGHPVIVPEFVYTALRKQNRICCQNEVESELRTGVEEGWISLVSPPSQTEKRIRNSMISAWDHIAATSGRADYEIDSRNTVLSALVTRVLTDHPGGTVCVLDTDVLTLEAVSVANSELGFDDRAVTLHPGEQQW